MNFEVGKVYNITHSRKGMFKIQITDNNEEWISGIIIEGRANAMMNYNRKEAGEEVTLRKPHISKAESVA